MEINHPIVLLKYFLFISFFCTFVTLSYGANNSTIVKVALLQMLPSPDGNQTENIEKATQYCIKAKNMGADIALMPEMWNVGYTITYPGYSPSDQSGHMRWINSAVGTDSEYVVHFQHLAKSLNMAIGVTYLEEYDPLPRNTISLVDRHGNIVMTYSKIHTCDFLPAEASTFPGKDFYTTSLDTEKGNITVGAMICYDREFPESARILMLKGAEVILTPNACVLSQMQIDQFKTRAFENAVVVAMANYAAPYMNGNSASYGPSGSQLMLANGNEGVYMAEFDIEQLRNFRASTTAGDAFRRPFHYGILSTLSRVPSFKAENYFHRNRLW